MAPGGPGRARPFKALAERNNLDPELVDDVIMGCVMQAGAQALNVGRNAVLAAGWPESVPSTTVDRQCGSSQQAAHFAAQGVMAGAYDVVVAAGVEVMSLVPDGRLDRFRASGSRSVPRYERYADVELYPGPEGPGRPGHLGRDHRQRAGLTREDLDAFGVRSQELAEQATDEGRFDNEIIPVVSKIKDKETGEVKVLDGGDGHPRRGDPPRHHDGVARQAEACVRARRQGHRRQQLPDHRRRLRGPDHERREGSRAGLTPRARFHTFALGGRRSGPHADRADPLHHQGAGSQRASIGDIDHFEVNEAFASVVLAWAKAHNPDMDKVNPNGGAIALGHPLGCSGTKLMATMLNELERTGGRYGLQTMCEGGGMANATIIERLG